MKSLKRRILVPLVPVVAGTLVLAGWGIERAVGADLARALDDRLDALAQVVAAAVDVEENGQVEFHLEPGATPETGGRHPTCLYAVRDSTGRLVAAAPESAAALGTGDRGFGNWTSGGPRYRTLTRTVSRVPEDAHDVGPRSFLVTVAMSTDAMQATLAALRVRLVVACSLLFVALVGLPVLLVVRAMRPLRRLSLEAAAVTADRHDARLDAAGADREVQGLVSAVNDALERLAEGLVREKALTANAAHELRGPLGTIRAYCELALRRQRGVAELRESIEGIHAIAVRLGTVTEKLLALARMERGIVAPHHAPANLAEAARAAARTAEAAAGSKGVELEVDVPERLDVAGDESLLAEAISNLVDNAIRHTRKGGRVRVEAGHRPGAVFVAVSDNGEGIAPEHLAAVFDRFYRVESARTPSDGNTGLGLSIAREIVRLHGGDITVTSTVGQGARFEIVVPEPRATR